MKLVWSRVWRLLPACVELEVQWPWNQLHRRVVCKWQKSNSCRSLLIWYPDFLLLHSLLSLSTKYLAKFGLHYLRRLVESRRNHLSLASAGDILCIDLPEKIYYKVYYCENGRTTSSGGPRLAATQPINSSHRGLRLRPKSNCFCKIWIIKSRISLKYWLTASTNFKLRVIADATPFLYYECTMSVN